MNQVDLRTKLNKEFKKRLTVISTEDYSFHYHYDNEGNLIKEIIYYNQKFRGNEEFVINRDYSKERLSYIPPRRILNYRRSNRFN